MKRRHSQYVMPLFGARGHRRRVQRKRIFWKKIGPWAVGRLLRRNNGPQGKGGTNLPPGFTSWYTWSKMSDEWWGQF